MDAVLFFFILIGITCVFAFIATIGSIIRYRKNGDEDELHSAYCGVGAFAIGLIIVFNILRFVL